MRFFDQNQPPIYEGELPEHYYYGFFRPRIIYENNIQPDPTLNDEPPQVLGATLPCVVGSGAVSGIWFAGGREVIPISTATVERIPIRSRFPGVTARPTGRKRYTSSTPTSYKNVIVVRTTTQVVATAGYLLAYDYFGDGYSLVSLTVDGEIVLDGELGIGGDIKYRFYGGQHSATDEILANEIGENAGAYKNFVMLFLDEYPSDQIPTVEAVITSNAGDTRTAEEIEWTGDGLDGTFDIPAATSQGAYDPYERMIYQILTDAEISTLSGIWLANLDPIAKLERYRVPLEGASGYSGTGGNQWIYALRGSGMVLVRLVQTGGSTTLHSVHDSLTGELICSYTSTNSTDLIDWQATGFFGGKYYVIGRNTLGSGPNKESTYIGTIDVALETFTVERDGDINMSMVCLGRFTEDGLSFFGLGGDLYNPGEIIEYVFDGDAWTANVVFTAPQTVTGLHYDIVTEKLVVSYLDTTPDPDEPTVAIVNPETGIAANSFVTGQLLRSDVSTKPDSEQFYPRSGFSIFHGSENYDYFAVDIRGLSEALIFNEDQLPVNWTREGGLIIDQYTASAYNSFRSSSWYKYGFANASPSIFTAQTILGEIASLAGYSLADLSFDGLDSISAYGFTVTSDTNTLTMMTVVADVYDFEICDTGVGLSFNKAGRDDLFSVDHAISDVDVLEDQSGSINSTDEADINTPVRAEFSYVSKDSRYQKRTASAEIVAGLTNSRRVMKFDTPIIMHDDDAQQFVDERLFQFQRQRRGHVLSVVPDYAIALPGDIATFNSDGEAYTTSVKEVTLKPSDMSVTLNVEDFQSKVDTVVTAVSSPFGVTLFTFATQYIHLDVPLDRYSDDRGGDAIVQYGVIASKGQPNWPGGVLYRGSYPDSLEPLTDQAPHDGVIAVCIDVLPDMPNPHAGDFTNSLTIQVVSGDHTVLVSKTNSQVLEGANRCYVGRAGRWESLGFATVEDLGNGRYTLSNFTIRGHKGTEVYAGLHAAGDLFVLEGNWVHKIIHDPTDVDANYYYMPTGMGAPLGEFFSRKYEVTGAAETPYAVTNIADELDGSDTDVTWNYRSRLSAWAPDGVEDSGEASLSFEIDVMDGGSPEAVLNTYTVSDNAWTYTSAEKTADWGTVPATANIRIYMMSALVGRGHVATATITL